MDVDDSTVPDEKDRHPVHRTARKVWIGVVGATIVVVGIILLPLPGPGTLIILLGLGILGSEFPAARRLADRIKASARDAIDRIREH